jgi:hypothetical protein
MIGRWIMRGLGVTLLTLCVAAWVASYWWTLDAGYSRRAHVWAYFSGGRMNFAHCSSSAGTGWYCHWGSGSFDWTVFNGFSHVGFAGFQIVHTSDTQWLVFPLWFPTVMSGAVLGLVWWRTRPRREVRGFPVETAR